MARNASALVKLAASADVPDVALQLEKALKERVQAAPRYWDSKPNRSSLSIDDLRADRLEANWAEMNAAK